VHARGGLFFSLDCDETTEHIWIFITTRKNVMNQSHFKVKACNGYQAREKHQLVPRAGKKPTGAKGGKKARIEFDSTSDRLKKKSHFLIGYSPLHDIF